MKSEQFLLFSIITRTVQEIVQKLDLRLSSKFVVEINCLSRRRSFEEFGIHCRDKLKILWDARDLLLVEELRSPEIRPVLRNAVEKTTSSGSILLKETLLKVNIERNV